MSRAVLEMKLDTEEQIIAAALDETELDDANERGVGAGIELRPEGGGTDMGLSQDRRHPLKAQFEIILQRREAQREVRKRPMIVVFLCWLFPRPPRRRLYGLTKMIWPTAAVR